MGCLASSTKGTGTIADDDPNKATNEEPNTPTGDAVTSDPNKKSSYQKFEDFPSEPPVTPPDIHNITSDPTNTTYSPKLQQVAQLVDLNQTIAEDEELEDVNIPNKTEMSNNNTDVYADDFSESEDEADKFNKETTIYEITDDMKVSIDTLIENKIREIENKQQYHILESTFSTKPGKKNGKTKTNQDSCFKFDRFGPNNILQFYGVCDGHGPSGHNVSQYCAEHLPKILTKNKERILTTLCKPAYALIKSFEELEKQLDIEKESGKLSFDMSASGTTVSCGLIVGNYLYLANLGDSRAVMGGYDFNTNKNTTTFSKIKVSSRQLTTDHDPKNVNEAERINKSRKGKLLVENDGSSRIQINLVDDKLAKPRQSLLQLKQTYGVDALKQLNSVSASVSRSIGDKLAHKYAGVISKPDIIIHKLNSSDLFVMWASDGIWTVLDNDDVTILIGNKLKTVAKEKEYNELQKLNDKIVREAHIVWQDEFDDYVDDITAVVARVGSKQIV
eukprot:732070_1